MNKRIFSHYENNDEDSRLKGSAGTVEFDRTKKIINRYLKRKNLHILDHGGATGHYSFWLADAGHKVTTGRKQAHSGKKRKQGITMWMMK